MVEEKNPAKGGSAEEKPRPNSDTQGQSGPSPGSHDKSVDPGTSAATTVEEEARSAMEAGRDEVAELAEQRKSAGADRLEGFAMAVRKAADELKEQSPEVARYAQQAAEGLERTSASVRERSAGEIASTISDFARRQPLAFFGGAMVAGFALSRFMKSSAENTSPRRSEIPSGQREPRL